MDVVGSQVPSCFSTAPKYRKDRQMQHGSMCLGSRPARGSMTGLSILNLLNLSLMCARAALLLDRTLSHTLMIDIDSAPIPVGGAPAISRGLLTFANGWKNPLRHCLRSRLSS